MGLKQYFPSIFAIFDDCLKMQSDKSRTLKESSKMAKFQPFIIITNEMVKLVAQQNTLQYDKGGNMHYDIASAFIKSMIKGGKNNKEDIVICDTPFITEVIEESPSEVSIIEKPCDVPAASPPGTVILIAKS